MGRRSTPLPAGWSAIRKRILARDPVCTICGIREATEVDHVGHPADHDDAVLRGVCRPCHAARTGRQAQAARQRRLQLEREGEPHPGVKRA